MPNYLNSVKKQLKTLLNNAVTVEGKKVPYYEGFAPDGAENKTLIFTATNVTFDFGMFSSKNSKNLKITLPIYLNYRGQSTPINDQFIQDVYNILTKNLVNGTVLDGYSVRLLGMSGSSISQSDGGGNYIQNAMNCTFELQEF